MGSLWPFGAGIHAQTQDPTVLIQPRAPQRAATTPDDGMAARIRVESDLVLIPVNVTDQQDRSVTGLAREQFRLWDEKTEQTISHFSIEDSPVSIGLVFDSSRSMGNKIQRSKAAVEEFIRTANPQDEFSLVQFNNRAQLLQGFTERTEEIQNRMMFIQPSGCTALLDAVMLSMNEMHHAKNRRKAILIISDGGDNNSRYSLHELKNRLRESDVQVYSIGILEPFGSRDMTIEEMTGPALLNDLAKQTGGRFYTVEDLNVLPQIAAKIGTSLRNQYVLGYAPNGTGRDGKYHRVRVKVTQPKGLPSLRASFRSGYMAPEN